MFAVIAISLPPLLILVVDKFYRRVKDHPAVGGFVRGLSLAVVGIFVMILIGLMRNTGLDIRSVLIATAAIGLGLTRRVPIIGIIALAALVGIVA
jgi:chromate transporter